MESNEKPEDEKHETGFEEKENLELSSSVAADECHKEENVISELPMTRFLFMLLQNLLHFF